MSKLKSNDGISCDICGIACKTQFVYYSYDFVKIVINESFPPNILQVTRKPVRSLDVCVSCNDNFAIRVINSNKLKLRVAFCELSGVALKNCIAYIVFVNEVTVNMNSSPPVSVDRDYLSFVISDTENAAIKVAEAKTSWETKS